MLRPLERGRGGAGGVICTRPHPLGRGRDVLEVELRVDVDQTSLLGGELEVLGELAVAVEDAALRVEAGLQRGEPARHSTRQPSTGTDGRPPPHPCLDSEPQLVARDEDGARAELAEVLHDLQVVVSLDGVPDDRREARQGGLVCLVVASELRLAVQVERRLWDRVTDVLDLRERWRGKGPRSPLAGAGKRATTTPGPTLTPSQYR